jgi:expansin
VRARRPITTVAVVLLAAATALTASTFGPQPGSTAQAAAPPAAAPAAAAGPVTAADAAPLAGEIVPGKRYSGVATWYDADGGRGACSFDRGTSRMTVAMNWSDYETAKACGAYIRVTASNGKSVKVRVTNLCPAPCQVHQLDLSPEAFAKLADPRAGRISVTWKLLSPATTRTVAVRYKTGSSQWWCGIQVVGHRNPVARLAVRYDGAWHRLKRAEYNYFISPDGKGCGKAVRAVDIYGQRLNLGTFPIRPDVKQDSGKQFDRH